MHSKLIAAVLLLSSTSALGKSPRTTPLSQLPLGVLTQELYTNDYLGVRLHFPPGWVATPDPSEPTLLDPDPEALVNQCSRLLLRIEAPGKTDGRFSSWGMFFAIDSRCISFGSFPRNVEERDKLKKLSGRFFELFKNSPFIAPSGADYLLYQGDEENFVNIILEGKKSVDAAGKLATSGNASISVNTYLQILGTERYWIVMASVSDDNGKEELTKYGKSEVWVKDR